MDQSVPKSSPKRGLAAIIGATAATAVLIFTANNEGTVTHTYMDKMSGILTYCNGATENAAWGREYTPTQCRAQLDRDLARHAEGVMACVHAPLTDGQKVAFVDLAYNVGVSAFCHSTAARLANSGDLVGSCDALLPWDKAGGVVYPGLTRRRKVEREICLGKKPL